MKQFLVILFLFLNSIIFCQKQAQIWHFGNGRSLDFTSGEPVKVNGSQIYTFEGCASYCDKFGKLLFYTNGGCHGSQNGRIWNKNNSVMYDMLCSQGGGLSSTQSSVFFEAPGEDSIYYLFTMDELENSSNSRGLSYFKIDIRLNNGLGGVVLADQRVKTPSYEALCAIRHANKKDYWILIRHDLYYIGVYKVTTTGVSFKANYYVPSEIFSIKASPDGSKVATTKYLLNFDNSTGSFFGSQTYSTYIGSGEFSPNSRFYYSFSRIQSSSTILLDRFNLQASNITASKVTLDTIGVGSGINNGIMQLATDGKIYFVIDSFFGSSAIHRISCPNTFTPTVERNVIVYNKVGGNDTFYDLPNFPAWLFENYDSTYVELGSDTINLCDVGGFVTLNSGNPGATHLWSTGDTTQSISVNIPGTYSVLVTGSCGIGNDTVTITSCALPLNLLKFIATKDYKAINLEWKTANEINVSHFSLERSINGTKFNEIKKLLSSGTVALPQFYNYIDSDLPLADVIYYRLKMNDKDGKFTYSNVLSVKTNNTTKAEVFPNPVMTMATIKLRTQFAEKITLKIVSVIGKALFSKTYNLKEGNNLIALDTKQLASGVYAVVIVGQHVNEHLILSKQ